MSDRPQEPEPKDPPRWMPLRGQDLFAERLRRIRALADQLTAELAKAGAGK